MSDRFERARFTDEKKCISRVRRRARKRELEDWEARDYDDALRQWDWEFDHHPYDEVYE